MGKKIKHTKNELKAQRDSLKRFERYLPTLQLKKQQLQMEMRQLEAKILEKKEQEVRARDHLSSWVKLYTEKVDFDQYLKLTDLKTSEGNIAGVSIPVLENLVFEESPPDLFETPAWLDDGINMLKELMQLRVERQILEEQHKLLTEELRTTTQRVNLFEKVKIPECREHIRVIRIFLGDQQTAAVARAKIAKGKSDEKEEAA